jgi:hypothetical protein
MKLQADAAPPCCSVSRHELSAHRAASKDQAVRDAIEQRRFEQICARELLGDTD